MSENIQREVHTGIRAGYNRWALVYDHDANPLPALEEPRMRDAVGDVKGLNVLDLGCGTGRHALWLAQQGATVTAIDFSQPMLAEASKKPGADMIRFVIHDLHRALPFVDASFDLVVSSLVLEHIHELAAFFMEVRRVLRRHGRGVISTFHPAMFLRGSQARFTDPDSGEIVQPGSYAHTFGEMILAVLQAGFRINAINEYAPDAALAARCPRAEKYIGWPMLVMFRLSRP